MTEEKNINVDAEKDKFADEVLIEDELDNVAGSTIGKTRATLLCSSTREPIVPPTVGGK